MNAISVLVNMFPPNPAVMSRLKKEENRSKKRKELPSSSSSSPSLAVVVSPTSLVDDSTTWKSSFDLESLDRPNNMPINDRRVVHVREKSRTTDDGLVELGRGSFGVVYKMERLGMMNVAIKMIPKERLFDNYRRELLRREISIHKNLDHAHVVSLYDDWEDETTHTLAIEFAAFGDLQNFRQQNMLPRTQMVLYIRQITSALEHLASLSIAHRDLKGENVLVFDDDTVKLADFGWAIQLSDENYHRATLCGTPEFVPPEMIQGNELCLYDARHVDQWSLGILTWELLEPRGLFHMTSATIQEMMEELGFENPNDTTFALIKKFKQLDVTHTTDSTFADFCTQLIVFNPHLRMSFTQALSHSFLSGCSRENSGEHISGRNIKRRCIAIK